MRIAAINRISDQSILIDIAKNDNDLSVFKATADRITNQSVRAEIENKIKEQWKVRILKVTSSNKVPVSGGFQTAPVGSRWIMIDIELTIPETSLAPQDIQIKDKSGNTYSAEGLSAHPDLNESPEYGSFRDWESMGFINEKGNLLWVVAHGKLEILKTSPQKISFLFLPPSGIKPTSFIFGLKVVALTQ